MTLDIGKSTRVDDAYDRLKWEIRSNRLAPGYMAPETEIATYLGMSRTPVREALIRLEAEGLIELIPRRGMRVLPVALKDMEEIYEILTALEPEAAANLASTKPSLNDLAPLETAVDQMEEALDQEDLDQWAEADDWFHQRLLDLHGNRRLRTFVLSLYDQAHRARMMTLRLRSLPVESTAEHRRILENLRSGDVEATRAAFRAHRLRTRAELLDLLSRMEATRPLALPPSEKDDT